MLLFEPACSIHRFIQLTSLTFFRYLRYSIFAKGGRSFNQWQISFRNTMSSRSIQRIIVLPPRPLSFAFVFFYRLCSFKTHTHINEMLNLYYAMFRILYFVCLFFPFILLSFSYNLMCIKTWENLCGNRVCIHQQLFPIRTH